MRQSLLIFSFVSVVLISPSSAANNDEVEKFMDEYNKKADKLQKADTLASWNYETDMTSENKKETVKYSGIVSKFAQEYRDNATDLLKDISDDVTAPLKRQLKLITRTASSANSEESKTVADLLSNMTAVYSKTEVRFLMMLL